MMEPVRPRLEEILERHSKTTPGEWSFYPEDPECHFAPRMPSICFLRSLSSTNPQCTRAETGWVKKNDDAEFSAHAHQDIPAMAAWILHLEEELRETSKQLILTDLIDLEERTGFSEFEVWDRAITQNDASTLSTAKSAGGWYSGFNHEFVPLPEWLERFKAWKEKQC